MGFSDCTKGPYQFKSVSLRTNEEFLRLYNGIVEARQSELQKLCFDKKSLLSPLPHLFFSFLNGKWTRFQECLKDLDQLMKRAEKKNAQLSKVLAGIMIQCEQILFPALSELRNFFLSGDPEKFFFRSFDSLMSERTFLLENLFEVFAECVSSWLESAHKVVVSAVALLSFVYQYLIGCVDKGGSKIYSPGSLLFRLIFVAIVLFLGSYVWIKFRQASYTASRRKRKLGDESDVPEGVYRRAVKDSRGEVTHYKYEPRFKPRREKLESGTSLEFNCLSLGSYNTPGEAKIVRHIAVVLYGEEEGRPVQFEDGICLPFPSVTERENCPPCGKEKAVWVTHKTKDLYAELLREKARRLQLLHHAVETTGSHHGHDDEACCSDPSPSAPGAPSSTIELICFTPLLGGNGVVEHAATSESYGLGQEPPLARGVYSAYSSDADLEQIFSSMLQREENDILAMDDLDKVVGDNFESDHVFGFESTSVPPQSSALDIPASAIVASLPELGVGGQDLEIIEPHLNSATAIPFQQMESRPEQVQLELHVTCQEKHPEEFAGSKVELQQKLRESEERNSELEQKLLESEGRNSELQQKLRQSEVENEKWRSICRQMLEIHVSPSSEVDVNFQHGRISC